MTEAAAPTPPPLTVAASVVAVQGGVLLLLGVLELADVSPDRRSMGLSTAAFLMGYGVVLLAAAFALWRRATWARGPVLFTQLVSLGLAWSVRDTVLVAVVLAISALVALAGVLHPDSIAALSGDRHDP
ncbi:MAG TPA: hypothetical protein VNS55_13350 [Nocardioides sp.]|nr:hypothetical protein [Nocardioides sp.]